MKNLIVMTIFLFILTTQSCFAETLKVYAKSLQKVSQKDITSPIKFKIIEDCQTPHGDVLQEGACFVGIIKDIVLAKKGKRNGYLVVQITEYITPTGKSFQVQNPNAIAKITECTKIPTHEKIVSTGATVAGLFIKNVSYPINFAYGIISPDEGESRLESGVQNAYEKSFFSYLSHGKNIDLKKNTSVMMTFNLDEQ